MITIEPVLVVEGVYDKIKLSSLVDTLIITTDGFRIFHDREKLSLLQTFSKTRGVLILTDSDHAGFQIRNRLKQQLADGKVFHAYIPDLYGKEKRKQKPSAEGKLGVEGIPPQVLQDCITKAGVTNRLTQPPIHPITKSDFMEWRLSGTENASHNRVQLQRTLGLPENLSANMLLEVLNRLYTREEIQSHLQQNAK